MREGLLHVGKLLGGVHHQAVLAADGFVQRLGADEDGAHVFIAFGVQAGFVAEGIEHGRLQRPHGVQPVADAQRARQGQEHGVPAVLQGQAGFLTGFEGQVPQLQGLHGFGGAKLALPFTGDQAQAACFAGQAQGRDACTADELAVRLGELVLGGQVDPEADLLQRRAGRGAFFAQQATARAVPEHVASGQRVVVPGAVAHAQAALEQEGDAFKAAKGLRAGAGARWRAGAGGVGGANGGIGLAAHAVVGEEKLLFKGIAYGVGREGARDADDDFFHGGRKNRERKGGKKPPQRQEIRALRRQRRGWRGCAGRRALWTGPRGLGA